VAKKVTKANRAYKARKVSRVTVVNKEALVRKVNPGVTVLMAKTAKTDRTAYR